jgi:hypothetical protein
MSKKQRPKEAWRHADEKVRKNLLMVSMLLGSLLRAAPPADQRWKPDIPKVWDEAALADWATPLAGLNRRPVRPLQLFDRRDVALSVSPSSGGALCRPSCAPARLVE